MYKKKLVGILAGSLLSFLIAGVASAAGETRGAIIPEAGYAEGNYTISSIVYLVYNIIKWLLGFSGTIALVMFVIGGFQWLIARGESSWITKGKDTLMNAVIGLIIIFGSWIFINFVIGLFIGEPFTTATLFKGYSERSWSSEPTKWE